MNFPATIADDFSHKGPKYARIIKLVLSDIDNQVFRPGDRIPSIKEASEEFLISRDTVEKAYKELSQKGILISVPGKGYYVKGRSSASRLRVMSLLPNMDVDQQQFYYQLLHGLGKQAISHLYTFNHQEADFIETLSYHLGDYDYYVIWPGKTGQSQKVKNLLKKIPQNKLILVEPYPRPASVSSITQSLNKAWKTVAQDLNRFKSWTLVLPKSESGFQEQWKKVFGSVASKQNKKLMYECGTSALTISPGQLCFVWDDADLCKVLQSCRQQNLTPGRDIGIISMSEHPLKTAMAGGVSTLGFQTGKWGEQASNLILQQSKENFSLSLVFCLRKTTRFPV